MIFDLLIAAEVASLPAVLTPHLLFASVLVGPFAHLGFLVIAVIVLAAVVLAAEVASLPGGCCIKINLRGSGQLAPSGKNFLVFMQQLLCEDDNFGEECQLKLTPFPDEMCLHISSGKMPTGSLGRWILWGRHIFYATELSKSNFSSGRVSTLTIFLPTHFPEESIFPKGSVDLFLEEGFLCNTLLQFFL